MEVDSETDCLKLRPRQSIAKVGVCLAENSSWASISIKTRTRAAAWFATTRTSSSDWVRFRIQHLSKIMVVHSKCTLLTPAPLLHLLTNKTCSNFNQTNKCTSSRSMAGIKHSSYNRKMKTTIMAASLKIYTNYSLYNSKNWIMPEIFWFALLTIYREPCTVSSRQDSGLEICKMKLLSSCRSYKGQPWSVVTMATTNSGHHNNTNKLN